MVNTTDNSTTVAELRRKAEEQVASQPAVTCDLDVKRLLHELQVHQIELEMQNEELRQAIAEKSEREACLLHEIEERRKTEAKLAESEGILRDILESTLSGFWDWNLVDNTEYLSPTFKQMFGYEDHEMESSPEAWQRIIFPEDLPNVLEVFDRHVKSHGREPFFNEIRYSHRDGSTVWVICAGRVIEWGDDGTPIRMVGCHIDITDRKRMEREIKMSEERFRLILESVSIVPWEFNIKENSWTYVGHKVTELLGYAPEEWTTLEWWLEIIHPEDKVWVPTYCADLTSRGEEHSMDYRLRAKDGSFVWVHELVTVEMLDGKPHIMRGVLIDITERKQAEDTLRKSEERYRTLYRNTPAMLHSIDVNGRLISVSEYWLNILGYKRDEVIGRKSSEFLTAASQKYAVETAFPEFIKTGYCNNIEYQFVKKNGEVIDTLLSAISERDENGELVRSLAVVTDITERKQAEKALQEQSKRHAALIDGFPHPVLLIGKDRMIIASNKVAQDIGAVPGSYCWHEFGRSEYIPAADRKYFEEHGSPPPDGTHCWFCRADASLAEQNLQNDPEIENAGCIYDTYWSPLSDETYLHYAIDVTERSMAQKSLLESEERYRDLFALTDEGIVIISANGKLMEVNASFARMHGYSVAEMEQMTLQDLDSPESFRQAPARIRLLLAGEGLFFEVEHRHRDGHFFPVEVSANLIKIGGEPFFLCCHRDISERKRAETERRQLQLQFQQVQKLESLGVLAGGIAHDFNNILAIIMGYCSMTKMDYEAAENNINEIEKATDRGAALCRQMLTYAGKAQITQGQVNMRTLVDEMVTMLRATIPKNVVLKPELLADIPSLFGDASQIRQIVMNLIINASEAIGTEQGEVTVSLTRTTLLATHPEKDYHGMEIPSGCYICLEVTDNGCGMDEETMGRIFEPFYTTKFTGRGLGMSAVLGIIKAHNGTLQLESRLGHGTTFKIYLPVQTQACVEQTLQLPDQADSWTGSGTILLVEDESALLLALRYMLKKLGFTVIEAANGKEALEAYQKNIAEITMVLTDMGMPIMDGYELFCKLKQLDSQLPIIISSGFGDRDIASRIPREAMAGMLNKPYTFDQLQEVLKGVVEPP